MADDPSTWKTLEDVPPWVKPEDIPPWIGQQQPQPGIRTLAKQYGDSAISQMQKAVVGQNEFDYPELIKGLWSGGKVSDLVLDNVESELGGPKAMEFFSLLKRARGEKGLLDVIKRWDPELETKRDKFGNTYVKFGGENYYLNRSGLSERDLDEAFRDFLLTAPFSGPIGSATRGSWLLTRMAGQAVGGMAGSVASDIVSRSAGSQQGIDTGALMASALGGMGGEAAGSALGWAIKRMVNAPSRYYNPTTGELTNEGAMIFASIGLDPSEVSSRLGKAFAEQAKKSGGNVATARQVAADEFGIPLTRGQATQDTNQLNFELGAKAGARGQLAEQVMSNIDKRQKEAFEASKDLVGERLVPGAGKDWITNAGEALKGARQVSDDFRRSVSTAYDEAKDAMKGTRIDVNELNSLPQVVASKLDDVGYNVYNPTGTPLVKEALDLVDDLAAGKIVPRSYDPNFPGHTIKNTVAVIEEVRKIIGGAAGIRARAANDKAQRYAVDLIVDGIDDWLIAQRDAGLITGNPESVKMIQDAIELASKRFNLLGKRSKWDNAGATIDRMINDASMTDREAANYLYGASVTGNNDLAAKVSGRMKEILGDKSEEWAGVRRGLWQKLVTGPEGAAQPGPREVSNDILKFLSQNRAMVRELYSPEEQALMRRYAMAIRPMIQKEGTGNPSGSGYEVARAIAQVLGTGIPGQIYLWGGKIGSNLRILRGGTGAPKLPSGIPGAGTAGAVGSELATQDQ